MFSWQQRFLQIQLRIPHIQISRNENKLQQKKNMNHASSSGESDLSSSEWRLTGGRKLSIAFNNHRRGTLFFVHGEQQLFWGELYSSSKSFMEFFKSSIVTSVRVTVYQSDLLCVPIPANFMFLPRIFTRLIPFSKPFSIVSINVLAVLKRIPMY